MAAIAAAFTFDGAPSVPTPYVAPEVNVTYTLVGHSDSPSQWTDMPIDTDPQHGPNCEPPGRDGSVKHQVSTARELIFQCTNHIMTYGPNGNSAIRMTPGKVLDLSGGTGVIDFDVSTLSLSSRDWLFVAVQDWNSQEQKITNESIPSAKGNPRNAIFFEQGSVDSFSSESGAWALKVYDNARNLAFGNEGTSFDPAIGGRGARSAQVREHFQIVVNKSGHIKFWMPERNFVINETDMPAIPWNLGVVTFVHNTYSPSKGWNPDTGVCDNPPEECGHPNTWHWDNFNVNPSVPLSFIRTDRRSADNEEYATFTFDRPLPAGSLVRFESWGEQTFVSFDRGPEVEVFQVTPETGHDEHSDSYTIPGVTGATTITVRTVGAWGGWLRQVNNVEAFVLGATPSPTPVPTPVPTPQPTPTPTPDVCNIAYYRNGVLTVGPIVNCP